jgi:hypothetical protein
MGIYRQLIVVKGGSFEKIRSAVSTATMMMKKSTIPTGIAQLRTFPCGHRKMRTSGTWSANISTTIIQNQTRFLKYQRSLMANNVIPNTTTADKPVSASLK